MEAATKTNVSAKGSADLEKENADLKAELEKTRKELDEATSPKQSHTYKTEGGAADEQGYCVVKVFQNGSHIYSLVVKHAHLSDGVIASNIYTQSTDEDSPRKTVGSYKFTKKGE